MTREDARAAWDAASLTYSDLTSANIQRLRTIINDAMKASGVMAPSGRSAGTFRMQPHIKVWLQHKGFGVGLYCRAFYFKDREAVTFNDGGFIGFAGWADDINVQPILSGFTQWVSEISARAS